MGMGLRHRPPRTPEEWNSGSCDIMAVALHRLYGLPMMAEFDAGPDEDGGEALGYLRHAWVMLPDGRGLDAAGPMPMPESRDAREPDDDWLTGYRVVEIEEDDPHLLDTRETSASDYDHDIAEMRAEQWIGANLSPILSGLGIRPVEAPGGPRR